MANYNGNSDLIRGDKLFIYIPKETKDAQGVITTKYVPIAYSTSCSLEMSFETIDTANKMSGNWTSSLLGQGSWSISTDALIAKEKDGSINDLFAAMTARKAIKIKMSEGNEYKAATGDSPAVEAYSEGANWFEGEGYVTSLNVNAGNGEVASMSISITGSGELTKSL